MLTRPTESRASVTEQGGLEVASSAYGSARIPALLTAKQFELYCRLHRRRLI